MKLEGAAVSVGATAQAPVAAKPETKQPVRVPLGTDQDAEQKLIGPLFTTVVTHHVLYLSSGPGKLFETQGNRAAQDLFFRSQG